MSTFARSSRGPRDSMEAVRPSPLIALVGNPNCGKTALFNILTGSRQKVANYAGVTVERKEGSLLTPSGKRVRILDLPGAYSLDPLTPDEQVTADVLLGRRSRRAPARFRRLRHRCDQPAAESTPGIELEEAGLAHGGRAQYERYRAPQGAHDRRRAAGRRTWASGGRNDRRQDQRRASSGQCARWCGLSHASCRGRGRRMANAERGRHRARPIRGAQDSTPGGRRRLRRRDLERSRRCRGVESGAGPG